MSGLTEDQALATARAECERHGWPWIEPVSIRRGIRSYRIMTIKGMRGRNASMTVRIKDGTITYANFIPR
jgi:hypothetical protein